MNLTLYMLGSVGQVVRELLTDLELNKALAKIVVEQSRSYR